MECCSNLSWDMSLVTSLIFEPERDGFVQPGEKNTLRGLNRRHPMRRLWRRCSQSLYNGAWQKVERQRVNISIRRNFFHCEDSQVWSRLPTEVVQFSSLEVFMP